MKSTDLDGQKGAVSVLRVLLEEAGEHFKVARPAVLGVELAYREVRSRRYHARKVGGTDRCSGTSSHRRGESRCPL
jgi:hypothetical protein